MPSSKYFCDEGRRLSDLFVDLHMKEKLDGYAEGNCVQVQNSGATLCLTTWNNAGKEIVLTRATFLLASFSDLVNAGNFVQDFAAVRKHKNSN